MSERPFPPFVYAPVALDPDDPDHPRLQMHPTADDRLAVFVYSAIDRLEAAYGEGQTWVVTDLQALQGAHDSHPFDVLLLDADPDPDGLRAPAAPSAGVAAEPAPEDGRGIFLAGSTDGGLR